MVPPVSPNAARSVPSADAAVGSSDTDQSNSGDIMLAVVCTYGTFHDMVYAKGLNQVEAKRMLETAKSHKYTDARITDEKRIQEAIEKKRRLAADSASSAIQAEGSRVHELRPSAGATAPRQAARM